MSLRNSSPETAAAAAPENDPLMNRGSIGRYDLIYPLAQGGMATVYASQLSGIAGFRREVAIKVIHPHLAEDPHFVRMFLDEARLAAGIHHVNVAETIEVGEEDGTFFIASELVVGGDLLRLLNRLNKRLLVLEPPLLADIGIRVCRGLHEAHELIAPSGEPLGLVHRDISPSNILVSNRGEVKLIDFGVAYAQGRLAHTKTGIVKGKLSYLSPELIRGESADRRSDLFSLGIVLYAMATGRHPFPGSTDGERVRGIMRGEFPSPREFNPGLPADLERVIARALAPRRDDRYPTAAALADDLEQVLIKRGILHQTSTLAFLVNDVFAEELRLHKQRFLEWQGRPARPSRPPPLPREDESEDTSKVLTIAAAALPRTSRMGWSISEAPGQQSRWRWTLLALFAICLLAGIGFHVVPTWLFTDSDSGTKAPSLEPGIVLSAQAASSAAQETDTVQITLELGTSTSKLTLDGEQLSQDIGKLFLPKDRREHTLAVTRQNGTVLFFRFFADRDQTISLNQSP